MLEDQEGATIRAKVFNTDELHTGQIVKLWNVETETWKGGAIYLASTDETFVEVRLCYLCVSLFQFQN